MRKLLLRSVFLFLMCSVFSFVSAKDIYLLSSGDDNKDGLSIDNAVATLSRALSIASSNDVIHVQDFIDISREPAQTGSYSAINPNGTSTYASNGVTYNTWNASGNSGIRLLSKNLTIVGTDKSICGFDGKNLTRLIRIDSSGSVTFRNLTFKNGNSEPNKDSGSGLYIRSSNPTFDNCDFISNKSLGTSSNQAKGGAVYIYSDAAFKNCSFIDNLAKEGSAFHIVSGNVDIDNCKIENNDASSLASSLGAGIYLNAASAVVLKIKNTILKNNQAAQDAGGIYITEQSAVKSIVNLENCAIINNKAINGNGGAVLVDNKTESSSFDFSVINTTIFGNFAKQYGGAMFFNRGCTGSELKIVNTTITENSVAVSGTVPPAGLRFHESDNTLTSTKNIVKRIYNSILENNYSTLTTGSCLDISVRKNTLENGVDFFLYNSFIGKIYTDVTYVPIKEDKNYINYGAGRITGLATPSQNYIDTQNSIPLYNNSPGQRNGNARFLTDLNINTDQLGHIRSFVDGKCAVGAIEKAIDSGQGGGTTEVYQHFIIYGQSLSVGYQSYPSISVQNVEGNYMIGDQVWTNYGNTNLEDLNPLVASLAKSDVNSSKSRTGGIAECPLVGAVNHIKLKTGENSKYIATSCGTGGKTVEQLSKESQTTNYYLDFLYSTFYTSKITRKYNSTVHCPAIVWMQGEYNYITDATRGLTANEANTTDKDTYKGLMLNLKENMQTDIMDNYVQEDKPLFISYQVGGQYTRGKTVAIGMAQLEAANEHEDIVCVGPVYPVTDRGGHLDANGYRWYGEMIGKAYYQTKVIGKKFVPLQPQAILRTDNPKTIKIKYFVPQLPLVLDDKTTEKIPNYGFDIYNNNAKKTITSVDIKDDCVYITCSEDLTGVVEIAYAAERSGYLNGHGNLRDSDGYPAFYTYIDFDKKNADDTFYYPRDASETTLRPVYEPRDNEGIIYNKPYPLYNFSVAFYYKLESGQESYIVPNVKDDSSNSISKNIKEKNISVYQAGGSLFINSISPIVNIELSDLAGKCVRAYNQSSNTYTVKMSLDSLMKGIYIVKVKAGNETYSSKIFYNS